MSRSRNLALPILLASVVLGVLVGLVVQSAHPEDQSGYWFGIPLMLTVAAGIVVMLVWQAGWYRRSRERYIEQKVAAATTAPKRAATPDLEPLELRRAMATEPETTDAEQARAQARAQLAPGDYSVKSGRIMTMLVLALMLPAIVLQDVRLMLLGAIPIVGYCVYLCIRLLMKGGGLDQAYAATDREFAPLGLHLTAHPQVRFGTQLDLNSNLGTRMTHHMRGPMVFEGTRHGRAVQVRIEDRTSTVHVAAPAPDDLEQALQRLPGQWNQVKVTGDADGITVTRRTDSNESWVYDLWLAEALADGVTSADQVGQSV